MVWSIAFVLRCLHILIIIDLCMSKLLFQLFLTLLIFIGSIFGEILEFLIRFVIRNPLISLH